MSEQKTDLIVFSEYVGGLGIAVRSLITAVEKLAAGAGEAQRQEIAEEMRKLLRDLDARVGEITSRRSPE